MDVLVERYKGGRLNRPNDVVCHSNGCLYFTDPDKRRPYHEREIPGRAGDNNLWDGAAVYRLAPDGNLSVLAPCEYPNGLALSPDERTMYVANTRSRNTCTPLRSTPMAMPWAAAFSLTSTPATPRAVPMASKSTASARVLHRPGRYLGVEPRRHPCRYYPLARAGSEFRLWWSRSAHAVVLCAHVAVHAAREGARAATSVLRIVQALVLPTAMPPPVWRGAPPPSQAGMRRAARAAYVLRTVLRGTRSRATAVSDSAPSLRANPVP